MRYPAVVRSVVLALSASGCFYSDVAAYRPPDPAGIVSAQLSGGAVQSTAGLARLRDTPPILDGASAGITVSITIGSDLSGVPAITALGVVGGAVDLDLSATSANHLEIHVGGDGCVADQGTVHLDADAKKLIEGNFEGSGTLSSDGGACTIVGTLSGVPADRG